MRPSDEARLATIAGVASVEQSSTTSSSQDEYDWFITLSIASARKREPLYTGNTMLTFGVSVGGMVEGDASRRYVALLTGCPAHGQGLRDEPEHRFRGDSGNALIVTFRAAREGIAWRAGNMMPGGKPLIAPWLDRVRVLGTVGNADHRAADRRGEMA